MKSWSEIAIPLVFFAIWIVASLLKLRSDKPKTAKTAADSPREKARYRSAGRGFDSFAEPEKAVSAQRQAEAFPETAANRASCGCPEDDQPSAFAGENADDEGGSNVADYAGFLRRNGREAVVLAEILLPPNSRAGGSNQ